MKKILFVAFATLFVIPAIARDGEPIAASSNGKVTFDMATHIGYGYNITKSSDFTPAWGGNFFFNILKVGLYPVEDLSLELGLDFDMKYFSSKTYMFTLDEDRKVHAGLFPETDQTLKKTRGGLDVFSLNAPLHLKYNIGHIRLGIGAEATYNFAGDTFYRYRHDNVRSRVTETKAAINRFTYGFFATLGVNDGCFFFKYYPKISPLLPDGSVDLSFMTVGVAFGF